VTVLTLGLFGCGFFGGDDQETAAASQAAANADTTTAAATDLAEAPPLEQTPAAAPARQTAPRRAGQAVDRPWTPTHTGTIDPGMTREQVVAVWGEPEVERAAGGWLYLHYRNGCEVSCGTDDVVLLQDGQVVDAIVRGAGHTYSGVSSSPPGRTAAPTLPSGGVG
jgi:ketosteroid isomerase-like protein